MMSRRAFVGMVAAAAAGAGTRLGSPRDTAAAPAARTIHLDARTVSWELAPGRTVKASLDVEGQMSSVVVEFTAHNPGDWLFHCHKPMHMDGGMISLVKVR